MTVDRENFWSADVILRPNSPRTIRGYYYKKNGSVLKYNWHVYEYLMGLLK